jgi:toxin CcdB
MACRLALIASSDGAIRLLRAGNAAGYWLDCQTDFLEAYNIRFVVPLVPAEQAPRLARKLNPVFQIAGMPFVMLTQYAGSIKLNELGEPAGSLANHHIEIVGAFDFLITGI